ncbi:ribose-5-phosphate isomerase RpiA [Candidatus Bipolaricaulota bacterium]|nr:ribose-5-phosphate isomerase RpiA [Candidatus Bipolaricaulota bacterium]
MMEHQENTREGLKQIAVNGAMEWIRENFDLHNNLKIGVGSGSTVAYSFSRIAKHRNLTAIPTSSTTREELKKQGVDIEEFGESEEPLAFDLDGADEVDPRLNLIKGGGGCHYREKLVAKRSRVLLIVVDQTKLVNFLGQTFPLPVEVKPKNIKSTRKRLRQYGEPVLRSTEGELFKTDNGNVIFDLQLQGQLSQTELEEWEPRINDIEGVVENGFFVNRNADRVFVGTEGGLKVLEPEEHE